MKWMKRSEIGYLFHFTVIFFCVVFSSLAQASKQNYAVIGLKNAEGVSVGEADIIADRLRIELFNTGVVSMMERDQMQSILSEQGFQQSGACTDEACMVEMGQLLGVEKLVSGSIGKLGSMFLLNFRTIDVQTAKIVKVVSMDITGGIEDVVKHLPQIALQLVGKKAPEKPDVVAEPPRQEPKPEPKPEAVEAAEPKPVTPQESVHAKPPEPVDISDGEDKKNINRSGMKLRFSYLPGDMRGRYYWDEEFEKYIEHDYWTDEDFFNSLDTIDLTFR